MIDRGKIAEVLAKRVVVFRYADGVICTIENGNRTYSVPEVLTVIEQGTGRPAKVFRRSHSLAKLEDRGGLQIAEGTGPAYWPVRWLDDIWLGVSRLSERMGKIEVKPSLLWCMYIEPIAEEGLTATMLTHRHHIDERQARRYITKLIALDTAIGGYLDGCDKRRS